MKPLGSFGYILKYSRVATKASGRPFSFIMHQHRFTMIGGNIVAANLVLTSRYNEDGYFISAKPTVYISDIT